MKYSEAQTKIIIEIASMTFLNEDLQFLEGLEEFFRGNSRITSDCRVCSMLKTLSSCSMLADSELFGVRLLVRGGWSRAELHYGSILQYASVDTISRTVRTSGEATPPPKIR